jgi:predicted neuraminidase
MLVHPLKKDMKIRAIENLTEEEMAIQTTDHPVKDLKIQAIENLSEEEMAIQTTDHPVKDLKIQAIENLTEKEMAIQITDHPVKDLKIRAIENLTEEEMAIQTTDHPVKDLKILVTENHLKEDIVILMKSLHPENLALVLGMKDPLNREKTNRIWDIIKRGQIMPPQKNSLITMKRKDLKADAKEIMKMIFMEMIQ